MPLRAILHGLDVTPIRTPGGETLLWDQTTARCFACDCAEHAVQLLNAEIDAREAVYECLETIRAYAVGDADAETLSMARENALAASRIGLIAVSGVAVAAAHAALPDAVELWPARAAWAARKAVIDATAARVWDTHETQKMIEGLTSPDATTRLHAAAAMANIEVLENEAVRRATDRITAWQTRCLHQYLQRSPSADVWPDRGDLQRGDAVSRFDDGLVQQGDQIHVGGVDAYQML